MTTRRGRKLYRRCSAIDDRHFDLDRLSHREAVRDAGIIERHDFRDGRARYEQIPDTHHDHLINLRTGEVIEFQVRGDRAPAGGDCPAAGLQAGRPSLELYAVPLEEKPSGKDAVTAPQAQRLLFPSGKRES